MMYQMKFTAKLFEEEKDVLELLQHMIKEVMPEDEQSHLIQLSQTNWGSTSQQFENWVKLFPAIIATYDEFRYSRLSLRYSKAHGRYWKLSICNG